MAESDENLDDEINEATPLLNLIVEADTPPPDYEDTRYREIIQGQIQLPTYEDVQAENDGQVSEGERHSCSGDSIFTLLTIMSLLFIVWQNIDT